MHRLAKRPLLASSLLALALPALLLAGCPGTDPGGGGGGGVGFNLPPNARVTSTVTRGVAPLTVTFDSSGSTDDGLIVSRQWDFGDGDTSQAIAPTHTFETNGDFVVELTLTDDDGATGTATTVISVTEAPIPVIQVSDTSAANAPAAIEFDATASFDPDGEIVEYRWDFGDGSREFLQTLTHVYATSGTFRARLTVTDDKGVSSFAEQLIRVGIRQPSISFRTPSEFVENIVVPQNGLLWIAGQFEVEEGAAAFKTAGLDRDDDPCDAQSVIYGTDGFDVVDILSGQRDRITEVAFATNDQSVFTASDDETVRRYSVSTGAQLRQYDGNSRIRALAVMPDGERIVWGEQNGDVVIADVASGAVLQTFQQHTSGVNSVAVSPNGARIISGANDRRAIVWSVADGTILRTFNQDLGINAVAFDPTNNDVVATASEDGEIRIWSVASGDLLLTFDQHGGPVNALAFSPDGSRLVSGSDDDTARIWDPVAPGALLTTFSGHTDDVVSVTFSDDGMLVYSGGADDTWRAWNVADAQQQRVERPCASPITGLALSSGGDLLIAGVGARNDVKLDTPDPEGNDLDVTIPQGLDLESVPALNGASVEVGSYFAWLEINTDRSDPVRTYAPTQVNVIPPLVDELDESPPRIPLVDQQATILVPPGDENDRFIGDLGEVRRGDRIFLSLATVPGYARTFESANPFSVMLLDANEEIVAWYQSFGDDVIFDGLSEFLLFDENTQLIAGRTSTRYYIVLDGGVSVNVRIQRQSGLTPERGQRIHVRFTGADAVGVADQPPRPIPAFDAASFNADFTAFGQPNPGWGFDETIVMRLQIMQSLANVYAGYDITFTNDIDDDPPAVPFQEIYIGTRSPDGYLGVADYVDPRNATQAGTAIVYANEILRRALAGEFDNPINDENDLAAAIGIVAAHEVGHLLGLRHTDDPTDLMEIGFVGGEFTEAPDPTVPRFLKSAEVSVFEQIGSLPAIGIQDAPQLLAETVGTD